MSILSQTTATQYQNDLLQALSGSGITQLSPGGKARALTDAIGNELGSLDQQTFTNISQMLLPYATGSALDAIAEIFGVVRLGAESADTLASDSNVTFYVRSGTFGDINNGNPIQIPANSIVSTTDGSVSYSVPATTLAANLSSLSVAASSLNTGAAGNVGAAALTVSNVTNYTAYLSGALLVTNDFGIVAGRDAETDDNLRYRVLLRIRGQGGANQAALQAVLLQLPGVQNVAFQTQPGLVNVYLYTTSPVIASSLLLQAQAAVDDTIAYPGQGIVLQPSLVGISLTTGVNFVSTATASDKTSALSAATQAVQQYINNLPMGAAVSIQQIANTIISSSSKIAGLGTSSQQIDQIFIWRSRADGSRYSRFLIADYTPAVGERIVVENIANPIVLTDLD